MLLGGLGFERFGGRWGEGVVGRGLILPRASGSSFCAFLFPVFLCFFCVPRARARRCLSFLGGAPPRSARCVFFFSFFLSLSVILFCLFFFPVFSVRFFCYVFPFRSSLKNRFLVGFVVFRFWCFFLEGLFPFCRVAGALRLHASRSVCCFFFSLSLSLFCPFLSSRASGSSFCVCFFLFFTVFFFAFRASARGDAFLLRFPFRSSDMASVCLVISIVHCSVNWCFRS